MRHPSLAAAIHKAKQELYALCADYEYSTHPEVVKKSQEIDALIVQWHRSERQTTEPTAVGNH